MSLIHYSLAYVVAIGAVAFALWMVGPLLNTMGSFEGEDL